MRPGRDGVGVSLPGLEPLIVKKFKLTVERGGPEVFKKEISHVLCGKAPQTGGDLLRTKRGSDAT